MAKRGRYIRRAALIPTVECSAKKRNVPKITIGKGDESRINHEGSNEDPSAMQPRRELPKRKTTHERARDKESVATNHCAFLLDDMLTPYRSRHFVIFII